MSSAASVEGSAMVICRGCLSECAEYKSLFRQGLIMGEVTTLATLLNYCTNMDFDPGEEYLPAHMCLRCVQSLARAYVFKRTVMEANGILRKHHAEFSGDAVQIADEETADVDDVEEQYVGTEELRELANAAQMRRAMDMEYVTLTVLPDDSEERKEDDDGIEEEEEEEEEVMVHGITETAEAYSATDGEEYITDSQDKEIMEVETFETVSWDGNEDAEASNETLHVVAISKRRKRNDPDDEMEAIIEPKSKVVRMRSGKRSDQQKPPNPDLQCQICGKQLSNNNSYKYHMQLHSDNTPFLCSLCGEGFKTRNAYEGHIVIHDPNNPNTCQLCGKAYRQPSSLRTHMLSHSGERPFRCNICGKGMTQKSGYKKHMLTHTGEMPHSCDICGRAFRYSSNLLAHKRWHTGEKPYKCETCHKCFPTTEQRKRHMLVHNGERPFSCSICEKRFKRRSSLVSHTHTHDVQINEDEVDEDEEEQEQEQEIDEKLIDHKVLKSNVIELY